MSLTSPALQMGSLPLSLQGNPIYVRSVSRSVISDSLPFPSPEDLPNPGIEPGFPVLQADSLPSEPHLGPKWQVSFPRSSPS